VAIKSEGTVQQDKTLKRGRRRIWRVAKQRVHLKTQEGHKSKQIAKEISKI